MVRHDILMHLGKKQWRSEKRVDVSSELMASDHASCGQQPRMLDKYYESELALCHRLHLDFFKNQGIYELNIMLDLSKVNST